MNEGEVQDMSSGTMEEGLPRGRRIGARGYREVTEVEHHEFYVALYSGYARQPAAPRVVNDRPPGRDEDARNLRLSTGIAPHVYVRRSGGGRACAHRRATGEALPEIEGPARNKRRPLIEKPHRCWSALQLP